MLDKNGRVKQEASIAPLRRIQ